MKKYLSFFIIMIVLILIPHSVQASTYVSNSIELEDTVVFDTSDFRMNRMLQTFDSNCINQLNEEEVGIYGYYSKKIEDVKNVYYEDDPLHGDYPSDIKENDSLNKYVIHSKSSSGIDVYSLDFDDFDFGDYISSFSWTITGVIVIACCIGITMFMWVHGAGISMMEEKEENKQVISFISIVVIWLLISIPMSIDTGTLKLLPMLLIFTSTGITVFIGSLVGAFRSIPRMLGLIVGGFLGVSIVFILPAILSSSMYGLAFLIGLICISLIMVKIRIQNLK